MSPGNYSIALRCIAQDLGRRGAKLLEIRREAGHFIALCAWDTGETAASPTVNYTPADIELLDRCGEGQRGKRHGKLVLHEGQMLRAIGDYLDRYESTLIRISKIEPETDEAMFRVEYVTREGETVIDERPGSAIFDMCVLMCQNRRGTAGSRKSSRRRI